jgi:hypothetical protein
MNSTVTYNRIRSSEMFKSLLNTMYPRTVGDMLKWANHLWTHHGIYSQAITRAVRYFMTDFEVGGDDDISASVRKECEDVLHRKMNLLGSAALIGDDLIGFGNTVSSVYRPFWRSLRCPNCASSRSLHDLHSEVKFDGEHFKGKCWTPRCKGKGDVEFEVVDTPRSGPDLKPNVIRWPPQWTELTVMPLSGRKRISVDVTKYDWLAEPVRKRDPLFLEDMPMEVLQALYKGVPLDLDENRVLHLATDCNAYRAPELRGWGQPLFLSEFEDALMVMLLDRFNQIIVTEGVVPFRLVTPAPQGQAGAQHKGMDQMLGVDMDNARGVFEAMMMEHQRNPSGVNFFPFPVNYQTMGGDAKMLVPIELMEHSERRLLQSMGIPMEFYSSNMPVGAMAPAINFKMFERFWQHLANSLDAWLTFVQHQLSAVYKWEKAQTELIPIALHEDPMLQDLKLQLAAAGQIRKSTAYRGLGMDAMAERKGAMAEEEMEMELLEDQRRRLQARGENMAAIETPTPGAQMMMDEEMAAQQGGGMPPGGGMPMGGGAMPTPALPPKGMPVSLDDLMAQAEEIAGQLFQMDTATKRRELTNLKHTNETLHHQVQGLLAEMTQAARTQGAQMARAGQLPPPGQM